MCVGSSPKVLYCMPCLLYCPVGGEERREEGRGGGGEGVKGWEGKRGWITSHIGRMGV